MISSSSGSGFLVSEEGLVLTNAHVVQNMKNVTVTLADGSSLVGDIVSLDPATDLAVVQLRNPKQRKFETIKLGDSSVIRPGEFVVAMGSPLRLSNTVTSGIVSTVHRAAGDLSHRLPHVEYIQTDAAINVGNSGGPLVNLDGEVIGINSMTVKDAVGISFAIPVNIVKEFLESTKQKKPKLGKGYIGIHMLTLTPGIIDELLGRLSGFPNVKSGVFIPEVIYDSPSHRAGIYPGDIITSINGTKVTSSQQVYDFVAKGDLLTIEILRGLKRLRVVVQPETVL
ncbi:serine protease HTRA2, mitochondrial-like isoform X2 [Dendronephthya gigantea]|nr:serine protease HTRA2, mitochondrial-like isoform X2 [Dendronephthya gigantea]